MTRDELLEFVKGKISQNKYDQLYLWTKKYEKRLLFLKTEFDIIIIGDTLTISYISTGAYLGDGFYDTFMATLQ